MHGVIYLFLYRDIILFELLSLMSSSGFVSVIKYLIKKTAADAASISVKAKKVIFIVSLLFCYLEFLRSGIINKKRGSRFLFFYLHRYQI